MTPKIKVGAVGAFCMFGTLAMAAQAAPAASSESAEPQAPKTDLSQKKGSLSDKLNSTNGVVHPEGTIDPAIRKPTPTDGAMPVIPPPGTPGGNPDVQPK